MKTKVAKIVINKFQFLNVKNVNNTTYASSLWLVRHYSTSTYCTCVLIFLNLVNIGLCNNVNANQENIQRYANESLLEAHELFEDSSGMIWSQFLEDYIVSQSNNSRMSKDLFMSNINESPIMHSSNVGPIMQAPINYHSSAYRRPGIIITKRIGESPELEPHRRPPPPVVNPQFRPMTNPQQPNFLQQLFGVGGGTGGGQLHQPPPAQHQSVQLPQQPFHHQTQQMVPQNFRAVSENDLYLLGAIEKLVYRVDYLESRIRRAEQLIYYLMAGNTQKEVRDPCPTNFTRINDNCYYINSHQQVNWKTANSACKSLSSHLAEFEKVSENEEIMAYLLNQPNHRGLDFWLGGLNPGLLWIWSNSAKPVNPNMNLTSIAMSHDNNTLIASNNEMNSSNSDNDNASDSDDKPTKRKKDQSTTKDAILNNTIEIKGQGRCLRLSYNPAKHTYIYYGQECTSRHHYICEHEDKTLDNKIKKITRELKLFD